MGVEAARRLAKACEIEPGLSEADHGFEFSVDHRAFLAAGPPVASPLEGGRPGNGPGPV